MTNPATSCIECAPAFQGAHLREPIDRHHHIDYMARRIVGERFIDPPTTKRPSCPSSIPAYRSQWFDDQNFSDPRYIVPPNRLVPARKRVPVDCPHYPLCDRSFPIRKEMKEHVEVIHCGFTPAAPELVWDNLKGQTKTKAERCYVPFNTDAEYAGMQTSWHDSTPREIVPLSRALGFSTPIVSQLPPAPSPNASLYEEFHIPELPRRSAATTVRNVENFRGRRDSLLFQRRLMYEAGEQLLQESVQKEKDQAKSQNTGYTGFQNDHTDTRTYCKQCGATFFTATKSRLRCRDCGWLKHERRARDNDEVLEMQGRDPDVFVAVGRGFHIEGESVDKETTVTPARHHPLVAKLKMKYNQFTVEQVVAHPDFHIDANTLAIQNTSPRDVAAQKGIKVATFHQQTSRARRELQVMSNPMDFFRRDIIGSRKDPIPVGFNVSICLNDRVELKYLGALTDSPQTYLKALLRHQKTTIKDALKGIRRKAKQNGWTKKMLQVEGAATRVRIEAAYFLHIERLEHEIQEQWGALSGFPTKVGGNAHEHHRSQAQD